MKYGFDYMGRTYAWHKKELYRLPFQIGLTFYGVKKCAKWKDGFYLGSQRKSRSQLEAMTNKRIEFEFVESEDVPF